VIENDGTIDATSSDSHPLTIIISGSITGTGKLEITNNATLVLDGPVESTQTVVFVNDPGQGASGELVLGDPTHFYALISGFGGNEKIDFTNITSATAQVSTSYDLGTNITTLVITDGMNTDSIKLVGDYTKSNWTLSFDSVYGGTVVVDPPASTTTADVSTTTTDPSITTIDATTTTTDASTATADGSTTTTETSTKTTDATVTLVAEASTLTATETTSSRRKASSAAGDEAIMVAFSTAVAFAVSAAVSHAGAGEISSLATRGDDTAIDTSGAVSGSDSSMVDSAAAAAFNPVPDRMAGAVADNQFVEVVDGKLAIAETEVLKADAAATLQLDGSHATDALVVTDGANTETVDLSGHHTINTARNVSDDGRGGKITHASPVSATGEDTSVQSTSADNDLTVSRPFTATLSGNEDHSSFWFKPNLDQHASANPEISYIANPALQHPADNLPHGVAQLADNGSPAVADGAHPAQPHFDGNQRVDFKFADDDSVHPGAGPHDPPPLTALSNDPSGDHPAHPFNPNSDHHASVDPGIDDIAKGLPQRR
jgi:hypothetical protein